MLRLHRFLFSATVFSATVFLLLILLAPVALASVALAEIPVGGRVLGPDGRGLPDAQVGLEPFHNDYARVTMRLEGQMGPGTEVEVTTDDEGFFELLAPRRGSWKVVADAPGYITREYLLRPLIEAVELPPVTLEVQSSLELRILDLDGNPVEARIGLADSRRLKIPWRPRLRLTRSGSDGRVRIDVSVDEEPRVGVVGSAHPFVAFSGDELKPKVSHQIIELHLPQGVSGTVRATDSRGQPISGAIAYLGAGTVPLGRTDEEGRVRLVNASAEHEPPQISLVAADLSMGFLQPWPSPADKNSKDETSEDKISEGKTAEENVVDLILKPRHRLRGRVIERQSRDPVAGALVWAADGHLVETDHLGGYELTLYPGKTFAIRAFAAGYRPASTRHRLNDVGPTFLLQPAASVSGLVTDTDDQPVAGVEVNAVALRSGENETTRSGHDGRFLLSGLDPTMTYEMVFRKAGFAPTIEYVEGLEAFEARADLVAVLGAGRLATGRVIASDNTPVAGAELSLEMIPGNPRRRLAIIPPINSRADGEGRFRFENLAVQRYSLKVQAAGFVALDVPGIRVESGMGETDFGTVVLTPGVSVSGRVMDPQGIPLNDAEIHWLRGTKTKVLIGRDTPEALSDGSGAFELTGLRDGESYHMAVAKLGYGSETVSGTASTGAMVEVVLQHAGALSGQVLDEGGKPVTGARISAYRSDPRAVVRQYRRRARSDSQGRFRFAGLQPGTITAEVQASGFQPYSIQALEVPAGGEADRLEIVLSRGATLTGSVTLADGKPAVEVRVEATISRESSESGAARRRARTDSEGRFQIEGLTPGPTTVQASQAHHRVSKSLVIKPGSQRLDLIFEPGWQISGRVLDEQGLGVAAAALTLTVVDDNNSQYHGGGSESPRSASAGAFAVENLPAGVYTVTAAKQGYAISAPSDHIRVGDGAVPEIELVLRSGIHLRGQILGLDSGELASLVVYAMGNESQRGHVDYDGHYSIADLSPGNWNIVARRPDSGQQIAAQLTLVEGQTEAELDLEFETGFGLEGVVMSAGVPMEGVLVYAFGLTGKGSAQATTSTEGRFHLLGLPAGTYHLKVNKDISFHRQEVEVPSSDEVVIDLRATTLSGQVIDQQSGRPIIGATVRLIRLIQRGATTERVAGFSSAISDSRGAFRMPAQEGFYQLVATQSGFGLAEIEVEVLAGQGLEGLELRLPWTEGLSLEILLDTGEVPSQVLASVSNRTGTSLVHGLFPLTDGVLRLTTLPAGSWDLLLQSGDSAVVRMPVTVPGHLGQVRLPVGGTLKVRVPDLENETDLHTSSAFLQLAGPNGPHFRLNARDARGDTWSLAGGEAWIYHLRPGVWKISVNHGDGRTWTGQALVVAGGVVELVLP